MKRWLVYFLFLALATQACSQSFHFNDTSTTIIKTTAQSPAHWYLEIFNDANVKDTLRWRSYFVNIPPQWSISLDVQSGYFNPVFDGDSADFILLDSLDFPQKLIIGAETNGIAGQGSVFFDIYDPYDVSSRATIQYEFIITDANVGIAVEDLPVSISLSNKIIYVHNILPQKLSIANLSGTIIDACFECIQLDVSAYSRGIYLLIIQSGEKIQAKKIFID